MRKLTVLIHLKRFFIIILLIVIFIITLSLLIVGMGQCQTDFKKLIIPEFLIQPNNLISNESYGQPIIKVYRAKGNKVEKMLLEEYVRGVVAAEMPAEFALEALKAQAVAARTFGLAHMEEFGGKSYKSNTGANVCDTVQCQAFIDKDDRLNSWPKDKREEYWSKITEAVDATSGEVMTISEGLVMEPYYFATSSGKTEDSVDVFSQDIPYLKSVSSPGEEAAPKFKSTVNLSYDEFIRRVNSQYSNSGLSVETASNQVNILSRTEGGAVKNIKIGNVTMTGIRFRSIMGLNSANFNIKFNINNVEISCTGYGHGVGMSQWGANAMGKCGSSYKDILKHYYSGIEIKDINNIKER